MKSADREIGGVMFVAKDFSSRTFCGQKLLTTENANAAKNTATMW
jgi:hypothetical protein